MVQVSVPSPRSQNVPLQKHRSGKKTNEGWSRRSKRAQRMAQLQDPPDLGAEGQTRGDMEHEKRVPKRKQGRHRITPALGLNNGEQVTAVQADDLLTLYTPDDQLTLRPIMQPECGSGSLAGSEITAMQHAQSLGLLESPNQHLATPTNATQSPDPNAQSQQQSVNVCGTPKARDKRKGTSKKHEHSVQIEDEFLQTYFQNFIHATTIPGIRLCTGEWTGCRRIIWCITFVSSFFLTVALGSQLVARMLQNQTVTNHYTTRRHLTEIAPHITLCNMNPLRGTYVNSTSIVVWEAFGIVNNGSDRELTATSFMNQISRARHSLLKSCQFQGLKVPCNRYFQEILTSYGICWTFNNTVNSSRPTGRFDDLKVVMDVEADDYLDASQSIGVMVMFGGTQADVDLSDKSSEITLVPATDTRVRLRQQSTTRTFDCVNASDVSGGQYSVHSCLYDCTVRYINRVCGCKRFHDIGDYPVCLSRAAVQCSVNATTWFNPNMCRCQHSCRELAYKLTSLNTLMYPSTPLANAMATEFEQTPVYVAMNYLALSISFDTNNEDLLEYILLYDTWTTLASLCGIAVFILGVSLWTLVEVFELLGYGLYKICCRKRKGCF